MDIVEGHTRQGMSQMWFVEMRTKKPHISKIKESHFVDFFPEELFSLLMEPTLILWQ